MKTFKTLALAVAVSAGLLGSAGVMAANQGKLDTESTGDFYINYVKGENARIWGLEDLAMDDSHLVETPKTQEICIYSNKDNTSNTYELTLESANSFVLKDQSETSGSDIAYKIKVEGDGVVGQGTLDSSNLTGGNKYVNSSMKAGEIPLQPNPVLECSASEHNAIISVWFESAPNVATGYFTDFITMTVAPQ